MKFACVYPTDIAKLYLPKMRDDNTFEAQAREVAATSPESLYSWALGYVTLFTEGKAEFTIKDMTRCVLYLGSYSYMYPHGNFG